MPSSEPKKLSLLTSCVLAGVVFTVAFGVPLLLKSVGFPAIPLFGRRALPDEVSGVEWQDGTVYSFDATTYPGNYLTEIRWRGPDNIDLLLVSIGDVPSATVVTEGSALEIRWRAGRENQLRTVSRRELRRLHSKARPVHAQR